MERLQKVIAQSGYTSRRKAEELIKAGKVEVNGVVCNVLGTKVSGNDVITINGHSLEKENKVYYLFYKPKGVICSMKDEHNRPCVADYFTAIKERVYPVGRLDFDTTGVLFMSNDGEFANLMMHPSSHLEKIYEVSIKGILKTKEKKMLESGVYLEGVETLPAKIKVVDVDDEHGTTMLMIRLIEGKNRQVKKMFESVGHPVKRLHRIMIGPIDLKGLTPGSCRRLTPHEVKVLRNLALRKKKSPNK
jgi:23S rRNA pseudouridine2605 synthase